MSGCDGEDEPLVLAITDDSSSITLVKRCDDDGCDVVDTSIVSSRDFARTRQDADASSNHENGDVLVFPDPMDVFEAGHKMIKNRLMEGMRRDANILHLLMEAKRQADIDHFGLPRVSRGSTNLFSSAATVDSSSRHGKESYFCDNYKNKRDMFREELQKAMKFQNLWTELRQYMSAAFNIALEIAHAAESSQSPPIRLSMADMRDIVIQLCKKDPHQLFMRLVSQAQEFVVEVKFRLFALFNDLHASNLAEIFLTGLLNDYEALVSTANLISELVKPLKEYLFKFNLTWDCFIKKLYQIYVYNDALVQNNLPTFIGQMRKLLPLKGSEYHFLVHRYLFFDDEMAKIGNLWPETESWMDKYNEMQELHGQFSSLIAHTSGSDSQSSSPMIDFSSDSMPSTIEVVEMLLDDWNQAQHQKSADIAGALTATEVDVTGQVDSNCYNYARATCQLAQDAIRSVRTNSNNSSDIENDKGCERHTCNETKVDCMDTQCKVENAERNIHSFPSISNGFPEESTNRTTIKLKKKLEVLIDMDKKKKDTNTRDTSRKNINSKTSVFQPPDFPCLCVYQHADEIAERKTEILEKPPCPCLLNSGYKWDGPPCPCLIKAAAGTATNDRPKATSPISVVKANSEPSQKPIKTGSMQSAQPQTRHSTTQTPSTTHNHNIQGNTHSHAHGPLSDIAKNTAPSHPRLHQLNHTPHACHKQANVEHIKRVSCNDCQYTYMYIAYLNFIA